jgi:AAA ATPase domain
VEPLLERESELVALVEAVEAARAGAGSFVLVAGEAGIGKTSLLRALRTQLGGRAAFTVGAGEALSVPVRLGPVLELLAAMPAAGTAPDGADRFALARSLLDALWATAPSVAVIEDAHWRADLPQPPPSQPRAGTAAEGLSTGGPMTDYTIRTLTDVPDIFGEQYPGAMRLLRSSTFTAAPPSASHLPSPDQCGTTAPRMPSS